MLLLASCGNSPTSTNVVSVEVPKALLTHNETTRKLESVNTNEDLLLYARECRTVIKQCNLDKDRIGSIK